jgi:hypothetical protein
VLFGDNASLSAVIWSLSVGKVDEQSIFLELDNIGDSKPVGRPLSARLILVC